MEALDIAALKAWIGRTAAAEDLVTPRLIDEFRATFDPHLAPVGAGDAPLALHWCLAPPVAPMAELGPDGHPAKGGFLPPVPLPRRMWAGGEIETLGCLQIGDRVLRRSAIADVTVKHGRSGPLCFVAVRHELSTERGVAIRERHDIVYRDAAAGDRPAGRPESPPPSSAPTERPADRCWSIEASPVLLFRYSALTFNGHRIHYDHSYVTAIEGYPGLVVHGPLQATLLYNLAAVLGGRVPSRFRYRGVSPLTGGGRFEVRGSGGSDGEARCWTQDPPGRVAMEAEAAW